VLGFIEKTDDAIYLDNEDFVILNDAGIHIFGFDGSSVKYQITKVSKEFADVYKGDYAHFTLKEISEQPDSISQAGNNNQIQQFVDSYQASKKFVHYWKWNQLQCCRNNKISNVKICKN